MTSQPPPHLAYSSHTYLTLSTTLPKPSSILSSNPPSPTNSSNSSPAGSRVVSSSAAAPPELKDALAYVGPLGALDQRHIFSLPVPSEDPPKEEVEKVREWLGAQHGVGQVEVMLPKLRRKREEW